MACCTVMDLTVVGLTAVDLTLMCLYCGGSYCGEPYSGGECGERHVAANESKSTARRDTAKWSCLAGGGDSSPGSITLPSSRERSVYEMH